jgi:uncharacterized RDD family membrane protein YckC
MFCSRCGQNVPEGTRFCRSCGQEVEVGASAAPGLAPPPIAGAAAAALPYSGFWLRFVAYLIDSLIFAIPSWLVMAAVFVMVGGFALLAQMRGIREPREMFVLLAPLIIAFVFAGLFLLALHWLYFAWMESSERQATFGKAAMSLRVTDLEGRRLSFGHATGRFFSKIITGLIPLGIGYIMAGFTEKKQALHDMIAGTLVMRK